MEEGPSAPQSSAKEAKPSTPTILLHILSPSPEIHTKLIFPHLPTSTTVAELKARIRDAVASRPSPDRQRLIYRGRALVQEAATMKDIFSQETINQSEALSLHLVLPPAIPQPLRSHPSSATPNPAMSDGFPRGNSGPADLYPNHQGTPNNNPTQESNTLGTPLRPQPVPHVHPQPAPYVHPQQGPFPPLPANLPPHLQQAMRSHFEALHQQLGAPINPFLQGTPQNQSAPHPGDQPAVLSPNFHQIIAQQQQARAAAGLRGMGSDDRNQPTQTSSGSNHGPPTAMGESNPTGLPPNSRIVQENHGPNGEHWRMVIESTQTVTHPRQHGLHNHHNHHSRSHLSDPNSRTSTPIISRAGTPHQTMGPSVSSDVPSNPRPAVGPSQQPLEQSLSSIETALAGGTAPGEPVFESARMILRRLSNEPDISPETLILWRSRLDSLSVQATQLRASLNSILRRVISEQPPSQGLPSAPTSAVYLLSSPTGPYALLVSPSGMYTTPWQIPGVAGVISPQPSHVSTPTQPLNSRNEPNVQPPPPNPGPDAPEPQQQQVEQQANQVRDLIRILLPLGGHIWLLVRLFGFVYFFTGGGGYRRAILLGSCAFLVFIAQTGVFRPFLQSAWEPFRRHIENLLPLVNTDRRLLPDVANADHNPPLQGTQHQTNVPNPQQAAERLLREREQRDGSIMRQYLRRAERAIALFIASLVPGVGERHIAARDAAEAARREEASEREREREERDREQREREEDKERNERETQEHSEGTEKAIQQDGQVNEGQTQEHRDVDEGGEQGGGGNIHR